MKIFHLFAIILLLFVGSFLSSMAGAADKKRVPQTNRELVEREADELEAAEKKMKAVFEQLLGILNETGKAALKDSQDKWLAWREAQALFDSHHLEGGKLRPLERYGSEAKTTKTRTAQLLADYKRFKAM